MTENIKIYFPFFSACFFISTFTKLFKKKDKFLIPNKHDTKKTILLDPSDILLEERFDLPSFDWFFRKKKYVEEFLFNTALIYEIIFITDNSLLNKKIMKEVDPYGCASYNIYCENKKDLTKENINRDLKSLMILANKTKNYNNDLKDNILEIKRTKNETLRNKTSTFFRSLFFFPATKDNETDLLDLTDFLYTINNSKCNDLRTPLKKFQGKDFFETYEETRRNLFKLKNIFSSMSAYNSRKEKINTERIKFYENAKKKLNEIRDSST